MQIKFSQAKDGLIIKIPDTLIPGGLEILFNTDPELSQSLCKVVSENDKTIAKHLIQDEEVAHFSIDLGHDFPPDPTITVH